RDRHRAPDGHPRRDHPAAMTPPAPAVDTRSDARGAPVPPVEAPRARRTGPRRSPVARRGRGAPVEQGVRHLLVSAAVVVGLWWAACAAQVRSAFVLPPPG